MHWALLCNAQLQPAKYNYLQDPQNLEQLAALVKPQGFCVVTQDSTASAGPGIL